MAVTLERSLPGQHQKLPTCMNMLALQHLPRSMQGDAMQFCIDESCLKAHITEFCLCLFVEILLQILQRLRLDLERLQPGRKPRRKLNRKLSHHLLQYRHLRQRLLSADPDKMLCLPGWLVLQVSQYPGIHEDKAQAV